MGHLMHRGKRILLSLGFMGFIASASSAQASGDGGIDPSWKLLQKPSDQDQNLPFLNPTNDNRVNLLLMLLDEGHAKLKPASDEEAAEIWSTAAPVPFSTFKLMFKTPTLENAGQLAIGEGSRCLSNDSGARDFQ